MSYREERDFDFVLGITARPEPSTTGFDVPAFIRSLEADVRYEFIRESNRRAWQKRDPNCHVCKWDGGVDRHGKEYQPVWPGILRKLVEIGAHPRDYMTAQFINSRDSHTLSAFGLESPKAVQRYVRHKASLENADRLSRRLESSARCIRAEAQIHIGHGRKREAAWRFALNFQRDELVPPVVKCVIAMQEGIAEEVEKHRAETVAHLTYEYERYVDAWGREIPEELLNQAGSVIEAILRTGDSAAYTDAETP